jgi:hypothetical protein
MLHPNIIQCPQTAGAMNTDDVFVDTGYNNALPIDVLDAEDFVYNDCRADKA